MEIWLWLRSFFIEVYNAFEGEVPAEKSCARSFTGISAITVMCLSPDGYGSSWTRPLSFARDIICGADLSDPRYLYRFGEYFGK